MTFSPKPQMNTNMNKSATIFSALFILFLHYFSIDAEAQQVETVLESESVADFLSIDSNGNLYSTNYEQLTRINVDEGTVDTLAFTTIDSIIGSGVSAAGDVYYADSGLFASVTGSIFKIDTNGDATEFATGFENLVGIRMSPDNDGFYTVSYNGSVYFVNWDGTYSTLASGLDISLIDIIIDDSGELYLAYFNQGRIDKFDPVSGTATEFFNIGSWLSYISYSNGYIYATGWQSRQVYKIEIATKEIFLVAGTGEKGNADGDASTATFDIPNGVLATVTGDTVYVSDIGSNRLRRITGAKVVSVEDEEQPSTFSLDQNFPNPFNPVTTIKYTLDSSGPVKLSVFDMLGRELETLISREHVAGNYQVQWKADGFPSGKYLYRLETENAVETRQMTLLK